MDDDIKKTIAKNIVELRRKSGMTQFEVAEKLNYSDKAVSKWERAESVPDIFVLIQLSDLFGVTLDYLVSEKHKKSYEKEPENDAKKKRKQIDIMSLSVALVWFIATLVFVILDMTTSIKYNHILSFIYAVPVSTTVWLVFNCVWFNKRTNYIIISILMWSVLLSFYASFLAFGTDVRMILLLGVPGQIIILMWSMLGKRK